MPHLGIFELEIQKSIVTFEIKTHKFVKNEFLTHTMNFSIVAFLKKVLDSHFLRVWVWVKVCFIKYAVDI